MTIDDQDLKLLLRAHAAETLAAEGLRVRIEVAGDPGIDVDARLHAALSRFDDRQQRLETLAAVGQFGAGVTHEVRNVMTGILGFAQVARRKCEGQPAAAAEMLEYIETESLRCLEILTQHLGFTRPSDTERRHFTLAEVVGSVGKLTGHQLNMSRVKLEVDVAADLPRLHGDSGALKQVVLNLVMNAMQALSDDGGCIRLVGRCGPGCVQLTISDNGPGISAELAARIFEPFFTTKPEGEGTGLGLSLSRKIVEDHGGTLTLSSEHESTGAVFTLRLPTGEA